MTRLKPKCKSEILRVILLSSNDMAIGLQVKETQIGNPYFEKYRLRDTGSVTLELLENRNACGPAFLKYSNVSVYSKVKFSCCQAT